MRFHVNGNCICCKMCAETCPRVFKIIAGKSRATILNVEGKNKELAIEVMENCPMGAIEAR
jgi:ferredoxin